MLRYSDLPSLLYIHVQPAPSVEIPHERPPGNTEDSTHTSPASMHQLIRGSRRPKIQPPASNTCPVLNINL